MEVVITYGTFDLFHYGHLRLLERAAALGDKLVVGVSTDEFNELKGKKCVQPYAERSRIVAALRIVDAVFPEYSWEQKPYDIKKWKATVFVMGDDWRGKFDELQAHCRVVYLERTPGISTTARKELLANGRWG